MSDTPQPPPAPDSGSRSEKERTDQVSTAGWTAGLTAFFCIGALASTPQWPMAFGVAVVCAMVGTVCYFIVKR